MTGKFVPPASPDRKTFIMLHGLGSTRNEWNAFAEFLNSKGYGYFIYDLRGHGDSCRKTDGSEMTYKSFMTLGTNTEWQLMPEDLKKAVKALTAMGIRKKSICIIGASLGANIALVYSSGNRDIPYIILLSPGWNYAGIATDTALKGYGKRPMLICASPRDRYAYESSVAMADMARRLGTKTAFLEGAGNRHGVQMFDGKMENDILKWIKESE